MDDYYLTALFMFIFNLSIADAFPAFNKIEGIYASIQIVHIGVFIIMMIILISYVRGGYPDRHKFEISNIDKAKNDILQIVDLVKHQVDYEHEHEHHEGHNQANPQVIVIKFSMSRPSPKQRRGSISDKFTRKKSAKKTRADV